MTPNFIVTSFTNRLIRKCVCTVPVFHFRSEGLRRLGTGLDPRKGLSRVGNGRRLQSTVPTTKPSSDHTHHPHSVVTRLNTLPFSLLTTGLRRQSLGTQTRPSTGTSLWSETESVSLWFDSYGTVRTGSRSTTRTLSRNHGK